MLARPVQFRFFYILGNMRRAWSWLLNHFKKIRLRPSKKPKPPRWQLSNEQVDKVSQEELKFVYDHIEKTVKDSIDTASIITTKTTTLLTLTVGLLAALVSYSISRFDKKELFDSFLNAAIIGSIYLFLLAVILSFNIKPMSYFPLGTDAKPFFRDTLFHYSDKEKRLKMYYVNEIESYEVKLFANLEMNERRWLIYMFAYVALIMTPLVLIVSYVIVDNWPMIFYQSLKWLLLRYPALLSLSDIVA
jgi:hypothetical protein